MLEKKLLWHTIQNDRVVVTAAFLSVFSGEKNVSAYGNSGSSPFLQKY
jgi:hypothetical protein